MPEVEKQKLGNIYKFNATGNKEYPDGVYRVTLNLRGIPVYRGLVVEIDGDDGKRLQPRVTATKMWEHLMYSKLVAGGGVSSIKTNGFTLRVNIGRTEVDRRDLAAFAEFHRNPVTWKKENASEWQMWTVKALGSLLGSIVFCLRDMVMCMAANASDEGPNNWLFHRYRNDYHVNMFVGPFVLDLTDSTVNAVSVNTAATQLHEKQNESSKTKFRAPGSHTEYLGWTVDFKCLSKPMCGATQVQYVLVENFQGYIVSPKADDNGVLKSEVKNTDFKARKNRGLMTLVDILNTPELFLMGGVASSRFPRWKRLDYTRKKNNERKARYGTYLEVLKSMCNLMQNFILYEIKDSITWTVDKTWPMRDWMDEIAFNINTRPDRTDRHARANHPMTPDVCMDNQQSLARRLKNSLELTLPTLDKSVCDFMETEGFDHIRDAVLYLRLVGITNIVALGQLARSHSILMETDKYHARVFNGLSVGTQSEMRAMFERLILNPRVEHTLLDAFDFDVWDTLNIRCDDVSTTVVPRANMVMRQYVDEAIKCSWDIMSDSEIAGFYRTGRKDILDLMVRNARFFFTYGVYQLARSFKCEHDTTDEKKECVRETLLKLGLAGHTNFRDSLVPIGDTVDKVCTDGTKAVYMNDFDGVRRQYLKLELIENSIDYGALSHNLHPTSKQCESLELRIGHMRLRLIIRMICKRYVSNSELEHVIEFIHFSIDAIRMVAVHTDAVDASDDHSRSESCHTLQTLTSNMMFGLLVVLDDSYKNISKSVLDQITAEKLVFDTATGTHATIDSKRQLRTHEANVVFAQYENFKRKGVSFEKWQEDEVTGRESDENGDEVEDDSTSDTDPESDNT